MYATVFFSKTNPYHGYVSCHLTAQGETAEACLSELENKMAPFLGGKRALSFRPADGMIFCGAISPIAPIGVVYQVPYNVPR